MTGTRPGDANQHFTRPWLRSWKLCEIVGLSVAVEERSSHVMVLSSGRRYTLHATGWRSLVVATALWL